MNVQKIVQVKGRALPLPGDDIDTDRVVPARFLKAITFEGMEKTLFCDERERRPDHPLDEPAYKGANIFIAGRNFGSGSSREHAPQAIMRAGFELILGISFAEIFAGNCFAIGMPTAMLSQENVEALMRQTQEQPGTVYTVDLEACTVSFGGTSFPIEMDADRRNAFLQGTWSVLENLRANLPEVRELSAELPYISGFGG